MTELAHTLRLTITEDAAVFFAVVCPHDTAERPCATYQERHWETETECFCTEPGCPCADGDHWSCEGDLAGYIDDLGARCRLDRIDQCWYAHAVEHVGAAEMLQITEFAIDVPVHLSGGGWESPITVESALRAPSLVPRVRVTAES